MHIEIPKLKDIFVGELAKNGNWIVANLESSVAWPTTVTKIVFRNQPLFMIPCTRNNENNINTYPAIAANLPRRDFSEGQVLISHYLSSLSWVEKRGINVAHWSGGNLPRPMGGDSSMPFVVKQFYCPYVPDPQDQNARWALAFYREGLTLNHPAYQCLSFFKVLNIFLRGDRDQKAWINANVGNLAEHGAKSRYSLLQSQNQDVGHYLYGSNRCAVAHAGGQPTVDPENPEDMRRLQEDLPLVQNLAEIAIEQHFGIKSSATVYREHLYELEGFREIFGDIKIQLLKGGADLPATDWPTLPNLRVTLALHDDYEPLKNMSARLISVTNSTAIVRCTSQDKFTELFLGFNFGQERLQIDVISGLNSNDDGSEQAARIAAITTRFEIDYIMNGILEVYDAGAGRLLGRCEAFLPTNIDMGGTVRNYEARIKAIESEADTRSLGGGAPPIEPLA